jgi:hypothetical protein
VRLESWLQAVRLLRSADVNDMLVITSFCRAGEAEATNPTGVLSAGKVCM